MTADIAALVQRLEVATGPDRELDAAIVAELNNATVRRYPPTDDFGPKDRWQFWSRDGAHFLGSEGKFKVPAYTASLDAALSLVPEGWHWFMATGSHIGGSTACCTPPGGYGQADERRGEGFSRHPALALCIAALRARAASTREGWMRDSKWRWSIRAYYSANHASAPGGLAFDVSFSSGHSRDMELEIFRDRMAKGADIGHIDLISHVEPFGSDRFYFPEEITAWLKRFGDRMGNQQARR